jgi:ribonuclease P protein component
MDTQGFLKAHRLSSKKDIEQLIAQGNSVNEFPLRFLWSSSSHNSFDIQIAVSIPKKRFAHAVDRNLLKRRIRESFRKQYMRIDSSALVRIQLLVVYVDNIQHDFITIDDKMHKALQKIIQKIQ